MQQISAVIIDDEHGNIVTLTELLKQYCPNVIVEGTASNSVKGYELINQLSPDVVFLDIEMPYGNGFDLLDKLSPVFFEVIFITAFSNYAIQAIKYAALDYILKPVSIKELQAAIEKLDKSLSKKANTRVENLLDNFRLENKTAKKIALPVSEGYCFESPENILYLQAKGAYTEIMFKNKQKLLVTRNLKSFEEILQETSFCRIHHSTVINIHYVKKYFKGNGGYVQMEDGETFEISIRRKSFFLGMFK